MKKQIALGTVLLATLALVGAACNNAYRDNQNTRGEGNNPPASTVGENQSNEQPGDNFTLKAIALGNRVVKFAWTVPDTMDVNGGFRVLHSAQPEPKYPGSYWYWLNSSTRAATWGNLPAGNRHFRLCQFRSEKCARYSNVVELEVK